MNWLTHMVAAVAWLGLGVGIVVHLEESKGKLMNWLTHMMVAVAWLGLGVGIVVHLEESKEFEERVARHGCIVQHVGHKDVCTEPDGKIYLRHP